MSSRGGKCLLGTAGVSQKRAATSSDYSSLDVKRPFYFLFSHEHLSLLFVGSLSDVLSF